ncbi:unnamed protein product [Thlaspi arvense]|uniref:Uncharacterized protein n=1 Tax=Thlaspi arvense TaxID=13288 RepID=A0AAU9SDD1_THLAR|nr:unnamed protein product [Thlaspi arvense]
MELLPVFPNDVAMECLIRVPLRNSQSSPRFVRIGSLRFSCRSFNSTGKPLGWHGQSLFCRRPGQPGTELLRREASVSSRLPTNALRTETGRRSELPRRRSSPTGCQCFATSSWSVRSWW